MSEPTQSLDVDVCYVTGNPCGTDTIMVGHGDCPGADGICYKKALRTLAAQRTALLKLAASADENGEEWVADAIREVVKWTVCRATGGSHSAKAEGG